MMPCTWWNDRVPAGIDFLVEPPMGESLEACVSCRGHQQGGTDVDNPIACRAECSSGISTGNVRPEEDER